MSKAKNWSKKKKIAVISLSVVLCLFVLVLIAGLICANKFWYQTADYQIVSSADFANENTKLIAHRGFRGVAPENTLPAFEKAGEAGFWGAECDIYRTIDGVWVVDHDNFLLRTVGKLKKVEKCTYDELMEFDVNNGTNIDDYEGLKLCKFDDYLATCEKYQMKAFIELKGENNTEYYSEIMDLINKYNIEYCFISFAEKDLLELRKLTDAPMMYLCQEIDDEAILIAKQIGNCGIDFNAGKEVNFENDSEIIKKVQAEGLPLAAWTIDNPDLMKKCLDNGIDYITTDCITY